jgi:hypothetical protein
MSKLWKWTKHTARLTHYLFNGRTQVEKYILESTCDSDDGITQHQKVTAARLTYEEYPYTLLKKVILERLADLLAIRSIRKTLHLLDYVLRVGDECVRSDIIEMQPILEPLSCPQSFSLKVDQQIVIEVCEFVCSLLILINDDDVYSEARSQAELVREKVKLLEIKLPPSIRRHSPKPLTLSPVRVSYDGLTRSPQGHRNGPAYADDLSSEGEPDL